MEKVTLHSQGDDEYENQKKWDFYWFSLRWADGAIVDGLHRDIDVLGMCPISWLIIAIVTGWYQIY